MKTNDKAQSEAPSVDELFDEYYPIGTVVAKDGDKEKSELMTKLLQYRRDKFKAKINRLIEEAYKKGYVDGGIGVINGK